MIRTAKGANVSARFLLDTSAAMTTNIKESAESTVCRSRNHNTLSGYLISEKISRVRDLTFVTHIEPLGKKHLLNIQVEYLGRNVKLAVQRKSPCPFRGLQGYRRHPTTSANRPQILIFNVPSRRRA